MALHGFAVLNMHPTCAANGFKSAFIQAGRRTNILD